LLHRHHVDTIRLQLSDAVWVLVVDVTSKEVVHGSPMQALGLCDWTVLVGEE
jgi:hypothetical protein